MLFKCAQHTTVWNKIFSFAPDSIVELIVYCSVFQYFDASLQFLRFLPCVFVQKIVDTYAQYNYMRLNSNHLRFVSIICIRIMTHRKLLLQVLRTLCADIIVSPSMAKYLALFKQHLFRKKNQDIITEEGDFIMQVCLHSQNMYLIRWLEGHKFSYQMPRVVVHAIFCKAIRKNNVKLVRWLIRKHLLTYCTSSEYSMFSQNQRPLILQVVRQAKLPLWDKQDVALLPLKPTKRRRQQSASEFVCKRKKQDIPRTCYVTNFLKMLSEK